MPADILTIARTQPSPLALFENPSIDYDSSFFDLIIPALIRPETQLNCPSSTIAQSRQLHAYSRELREESASICTTSQEIRARLGRLGPNPVDLDEIWRMDWTSGRPLAFPPGYDDPNKKR